MAVQVLMRSGLAQVSLHSAHSFLSIRPNPLLDAVAISSQRLVERFGS